MNRIPEFEIIQNTPLAALAIHSFIKEFYKSTEKTCGIPLPYLLVVLPIVFNEDSRIKISTKQLRTTSFYKAIKEEKFIPLGLQNRMIQMFEQSMDAINVSLGMGIIKYNSENSLFYPKERAHIPNLKQQENKEILKTAKNIGYWFASIDLDDLCIALKLNF